MEGTEKQGTVRSSIINLLATAMGGGLLSLPHALADSGALLGGLFLIGTGLACAYSLVILIMCARDSGRNSFESNAEFYLGRKGKIVVNVCLVFLLIFASAAMSVIIMDLAPLVLVNFLGDSPLLNKFLVGLCMNALMFPLSSQTTINVLRYTSFGALFCIAFFFVCIVVKFSQDPHVDGSVAAIGKRDEILEGLPIMFSAFLCQFNIFKIDAELREADKNKLTRIVLIAVPGIAASVYVFGGLIGYSLLGAGVSNNILKDFEGDPKFTVARLLLSFTNMFKMPLLLIPLRESVIEMLRLRKQYWDQRLPRYMLTLLLNGFSFGLACSLQSLSKVLGLLGCTSGVLISYVLPGMMFLEHLRRAETCRGSRLRTFSDLTSMAGAIDLVSGSFGVTEGEQLLQHSQSTFWLRKAFAWLLIVVASVTGLLSLIDMLANWKEA